MQDCEASLQEDDARRRPGHIDRRIDRDPHVRVAQARRVVDPVPQIAHHVPAHLEGAQHPDLLLGRHSREDTHPLDQQREGALADPLQVPAEHQAPRVQPHGLADVPRHPLVVPGEDHHPDPVRGKGLQGRPGVRARRIVEGDEAEQAKLALVLDPVDGLGFDRSLRDRKQA
ncbi:hypothetical protein D3C86_1129340 [compost metagenome]